MYIEEQKQKGFVPNIKVQSNVEKNIEKACIIPKEDILEPTSLDVNWKVKSQTPRESLFWYMLKGIISKTMYVVLVSML
jgi:hypothetical protein